MTLINITDTGLYLTTDSQTELKMVIHWLVEKLSRMEQEKKDLSVYIDFREDYESK